MSPIRLWSVVVSQPSTPGRCCPDPLEALDAARARASIAVTAGSPGRRRSRPTARRRAASVGHPAARLHVLRVARSSRPSVAGVFGIVSAASVRARLDVRQVGADVAVGRACRGSGGSRRRPRARKTARRAARPRSRAARRFACREPGAEPRRRLRDDLASPCARAGARRTPSTARGRRRRGRRRAAIRFASPGDQVDLPVQLRHPEAVDHVGGRRRRRSRACRAGMWISFAVTAPCPGSAPPTTTGGRSRRPSSRSSRGSAPPSSASRRRRTRRTAPRAAPTGTRRRARRRAASRRARRRREAGRARARRAQPRKSSTTTSAKPTQRLRASPRTGW